MNKRVLITGGNSGIGFCTAQQLAGRGAEVVLACRDQTKGQAALARIKGGCSRWTCPIWPRCAAVPAALTTSWTASTC